MFFKDIILILTFWVGMILLILEYHPMFTRYFRWLSYPILRHLNASGAAVEETDDGRKVGE